MALQPYRGSNKGIEVHVSAEESNHVFCRYWLYHISDHCWCGHTGNSARIPDKTIFFVGECCLIICVSVICYRKKLILILWTNYAIQRHFNHLL